MSAIELPILAIAVAWVVLEWPPAARRRATVTRMSALVVAGWLAEQSMIRAHGYYFYPPGLSLQVGHVPLVVILAWPVVLESAFGIARRVTPDPWTRVVASAVLVGCFAAVWQPLALHLQLVRWNAAGPFGVPPIGMLGAAIFGGATARLVLDDENETPIGMLADVLAAVGATHLFVLASWHAGLWRLERATSPAAMLVGAAIVGLGAVVIVARRPVLLPRRILAAGVMALVLWVVVAVASRVPLAMLLWSAIILSPAWALGIAHVLASRRRL